MQEYMIDEYKAPAEGLVKTAQTMKVKTFEQAMDAADFLLDVKTLGESITDRKEKITRPMNDALKSARKLFKPLEEHCAEAEKIAKDAILTFHEKHWKRGKDTDNTINGIRGKVTLVERTQVQINDPKAIPLQFCSPDLAKIDHALKAGIEVPGAELIATYGIASGKN
jgi:hypothetical protein